MTTFIWREVLSVSVGEMSRTQAIECCRQFDKLTTLFTEYVELMAEADILTVLHAPVVVKINGEAFSSGERMIELPDEQPFKLVLPLTRNAFNNLPMSLATVWISAAIRSNEWFIDTLKKVVGLTPTSNSELVSGNAPLNEPTEASLTTTTIGE